MTSPEAAPRFTFDPAGFAAGLVSGLEPSLFQLLPGCGGLYEKDSSGVTEEKLLLKAKPEEQLNTNSFDGRHLLYSVRGPKGSDLWVLSVDGEPKPDSFLATDFDERSGQFSSDGRWVAYQSNESGRYEIYVRGFPQTGGKWKVSVAGGHTTALAARRTGDLLCGAGQQADGGGGEALRCSV